jgi:Mn-dependent DtxR family transcriptional regulator
MTDRKKGLTADLVLDRIYQLRVTHGAVTLGSLAADLQVSRTAARYWVQTLRRQGMVEYDPDLPGSIRLS